MRLDELLTDRHVPFERLPHQVAYTASRMAQALHVPGKEVAKSVLLRTDQGYVLAVLPATHRVDLEQVRQELVRQELGGARVEMAAEEEMDRLFPDCERGAIPPFGSLYHLPTLVDDSLAQDERITFEAHSHHEAVRMAYRDYEALEHPRRGHFACPA
jgi:Ala-tRNA(Pro) deacylase